MRAIVALVLWFCAVSSVVRGTDITFPYSAQIAAEEVEVRCGPGWDYYATLRLRRGAKVEVHRHEPGGWLAIRPPDGSFSWVSERQVNVQENPRVAEVALDGAVAWIGSTESGIHQLKWQVRLQRGELLEVLGRKSLSVGLGFATETHYQVAPPAGEFRWIHAQHASSPEAVAHRRSSQTIELTEYTSADAPIRRTVPDSDTKPESEVSPSDLDQAIGQLQTDLSLMVTDSIERWDLNPLKAARTNWCGPRPAHRGPTMPGPYPNGLSSLKRCGAATSHRVSRIRLRK